MTDEVPAADEPTTDEPNITTTVEDVVEEPEESASVEEEVTEEPENEVTEVAEVTQEEVAKEPAQEEQEEVAEEPSQEESVQEETPVAKPAPEEVASETTLEVKSSDNDLENRVKELEERLEKLNKNLIIWFESFRAGNGRRIDISEFYNI